MDFVSMSAEISEDKVQRTLNVMAEVMGLGWVSAMQIMSLLGLLCFCGQVLVCGEWRKAWTVVALRGAVKEGFAPMNSLWMEELRWWQRLLTGWSRRAIMLPPEWIIPSHAADCAPFTDASRTLGGVDTVEHGGAGAVFGNLAMHFQFTSEEVQQLEICDTEGLVHVLWLTELCDRCPGQLSGKRFLTWCDNKSFLGAVNAHKSNSPTLAFLLGLLHELQARFSFDIRIEYVASADNVAADALSRGDWDRFIEFMQSVGVTESDIVIVPVQEHKRCSWSSRMRSMRCLQKQMRAAADARGKDTGHSSPRTCGGA
jgi:hypothetical protein